MVNRISLAPLSPEHHEDALQQVYRQTPTYWQLFGLAGSPAGQSARDLKATEADPSRYMLGIVRPNQPESPEQGGELVGMMDFRLHWPEDGTVYLGMIMVAEPLQRQGVGGQAWSLLRPWLHETAQMTQARLGVEQFNPNAMRFFESLGFGLTGLAERTRVGTMMVRKLDMQLALAPE